MSLDSIAKDIRKFGKEKLEKYQILVVPVYTEQPDVEDNSIEFHRADGRKFACHLQVSSLSSGSWNDVMGNQYIYKVLPLANSGFTLHDIEGIKHFPLDGTPAQKVAQIIAEIEESDFELEAINDPENKIVTNGIATHVVSALEEVQKMLTGVSALGVEFISDDKLKIALSCDNVPFIEVKLWNYRGEIKNCLRDETIKVNGAVSIKEAIKEMALASYSPVP